MAHKQQVDFIKKVKKQFPKYFKQTKVIDFGSLDVNGNNRGFFEDCEYTGVDLTKGKNVDVVSFAHNYKPKDKVDVVISTECFEHDPYFEASLNNMYNLLLGDGLMVFTCATYGRAEHGPSPIINNRMFYRNITIANIVNAINLEQHFSKFAIESEMVGDVFDLRFWGIKRA